ncbi:uncharacterized protein BXZ73DRAFT_50935 [Epithele typhae]|uniref:uncharacterized protein n=1 Tax=Epithele typhae TaxID=378194 RepID=UPI00200841B9|nr:uncharacterized protein BXZ73DRAFT_50935 [Epithele typhae]KAH9923406.1 hypothetical protein BXZ73DRAFT_50935 [Epithele typhae]
MPDSQQKTVRFVDASAVPRSSSPSSSTASYGSSPGPWTPPQLFSQSLPRSVDYPPLTQHHPRPSPPVIPIRISPHKPYTALAAPDLVLDPLLVAPASLSHPPTLIWDVNERPSTIALGSIDDPADSRSRSRSTLTNTDLASPAARRGPRGSPSPFVLRRMVLLFPGLPLAVHVAPSPQPAWAPLPLDFIAVGDVLDRLHRELRASLPPREYAAMPGPLRAQADRAFKGRHGAIRDARERERDMRFGVRKVDVLGDARAFVGIRLAAPVEVPPGFAPDEVFVVVMGRLR